MLLPLSFLLSLILFCIFYFFLRAVKLPSLTYYFFIFYLPFILSIIGFFFFFDISTYRTLPERVNVNSLILITFVLIVFFSLIGVFVLSLKIFYRKNIIKDYNHLLRYKRSNSSILIFIFGIFFAKKLYRMNLMTLGDFFRKKYNRHIEFTISILIIISYLGWISAQITALGLVIFILSELSQSIQVI